MLNFILFLTITISITAFQIFINTNKNIFIFISLVFLMALSGILILNVEFIFIVYLMVYIGATSVLFLFALVAVDPREENNFAIDRRILCVSVAIADLSLILSALFTKTLSPAAAPHEAAEWTSFTLPLNPTSLSSVASHAEQPELSVLASHLFNNCYELVVMGGFFLTLTVIVVALLNKKL